MKDKEALKWRKSPSRGELQELRLLREVLSQGRAGRGTRGQLQGLSLCGGRTPGKLHRLCHLRTYVPGRGHRSV